MQRRSFPNARLIAGVSVLLAAQAQAASHLWRIQEVFSNEDETVQFIELKESMGSTGETFLAGHTFKSVSTGNVFVFPTGLMGNTANKTLLLATPAFAALANAPTPDFTLPSQFFSKDGDTLQYAPEANYDNFTFGPGDLPADGRSSIRVTNFGTHTWETAQNSPTNFAGTAGSIAVAPFAPAASTWGLAVIALSLAVAGSILTLRRGPYGDSPSTALPPR